MSPRLTKPRKVYNPPSISGFKPVGQNNTELSGNQLIFLQYEEYESIRLCDYEMMTHSQAAALMNISRPTLTRIYSKARKKIAKAFVEGIQISIEGGKVYFDSDWYQCGTCSCYFNNPEKNIEIRNCPLCGSIKINTAEKMNEPWGNFDETDLCICTVCKFTREHQNGKPCRDEICPECGGTMKRKQRHSKNSTES